MEQIHVCILTPGALGSNPRVVKEANALSNAGHRVTVIATRTLAEVDARDDAVLADANWVGCRLDFRQRHTGWQFRRAKQLICASAFRRIQHASLAEGGISPFTNPLIAAATQIVADLYIAHHPAALPAAVIAARHRGALYAFDAEDFHIGEWPDDAIYDANRSLIRAIEGRYLPGCVYVTAASPGIADAYAEAYGIVRPTVLLNVFPRAEAPPLPTPSGAADPGPSVYWFSQTIGSNRGLECAVQAIACARTRPHLYLRGSPAAGFLDQLVGLAHSIKVVDRIHILPPAAPHEMSTLAALYDVGLSSEPGHSSNNRVALGNKIFTYLLGGLPVVMSDIPAHRAIAPELGAASLLYSKEDAESLAEALDALLGDPPALATARAAAFNLGQLRANWDLEQDILLRLIEQMRNCPTPTAR